MLLLVVGAVSLLVVIVSLTVATREALSVFRAFRSFRRGVAGGLARIDESVGRIEGHLTAAADGGERLTASLERLRGSRARLAVLRAAIDDVRDSVFRGTSVVPRK